MIIDPKIAVTILKSGGIVAYPTETVWGFGCDPWNESAVRKLIEIKQRDLSRGLILIAADIDQIKPLTRHCSREQIDRLVSKQPAPTTWLMPDPEGWIPHWIKGDFTSVAIRITGGNVAKLLCRAFKKPIVSTSANLSGKNTLNNKYDIASVFSGRIDGIVRGFVTKNNTPSCIKDLITNQTVRN